MKPMPRLVLEPEEEKEEGTSQQRSVASALANLDGLLELLESLASTSQIRELLQEQRKRA
jgi:hypothetical protein